METATSIIAALATLVVLCGFAQVIHYCLFGE